MEARNPADESGPARARLAETGADFAAAEADLLEAYAIFVKGSRPIPKDTRDCTQALANSYAAWDKTEVGTGHVAKAAQWEAKLDAAAP